MTTAMTETAGPASLATAPLRMVMTAPVTAKPGKALGAIFDFDRLTKYLPSIKQVETEFGPVGEPRARHCTLSGFGRLTENVVWLDKDVGYAYAAQPFKGFPMVDHLAIVTVRPNGRAGSLIRWEQYFNWKGWLKPLVMKLMFPRMMKTLGRGLQGDLGADDRVQAKWA